MYGSLVVVSNLIRIKPESPKFNAVISLLLRTQIEAVALPGKWVLLRLNFKILVGHKFLEFELIIELVLPFYL